MSGGRVVLVGAGHAHMEVLRQAKRFERAGLKLTAIDPGAFWYSGAITAVVSGALRSDAATASPARFGNQARVIADRVDHVALSARELTLRSGRIVPFDVLSLNTGSRIAPGPLTEAGAIPAKPVAGLIAVRDQVEAAGGRVRLAVVGAGATGVELSLTLAALQRRLGARPRVLLVGPDVLPGWPARAGRLARAALAEVGVEYEPMRARDFQPGMLILDKGRQAPVDLVVLATGLEAALPDGLPQRAQGLEVGSDLAVTGCDRLFAVGDCADLAYAPRPKLGVFGVRAAPVLIDNLIAAGLNRPKRRRYHPQSRWLSLLDCGDGAAIGRYGGLAFRGRWALRLKRRIDGEFVARYSAGHD